MSEAGGLLPGGRYRLIEPIGSGGMGQVWRGRDELLERDVAIKRVVFPAGMDDAQREVLGRRAMREARAAARLRHPGIVTVHDVVADGEAPVIVMEFVDGPSLDQVIAREGRLDPVRVARIGLAMAEAVAEAHAAGIVHRDLKPANVLLPGKRVVIADLGIASLAGDVTMTTTGVVMGTPAYMAPEQAAGEPVTPAADLWSLGATLYAAVEGRPPYRAPTPVAQLAALLTREPDPPVHAGPLTPVLSGLLRRDPAGRMNIRDVERALSAVLDDRPPTVVPPVPPTAPEPTSASRGGEGGPRQAGTGAAGHPYPPGTEPASREGEGGSWQASGGVAGHPPPPGTEPASPAPARSLHRRTLLALGGLGAAAAVGVPAAILLNGDRRESPEVAALRTSPQVSARSGGSSTLAVAGEWRRVATLRGHTAVIFSVAFSPDGSVLASASEDRTIRIWDPVRHIQLAVHTGHRDYVRAIAYSPTGTLLASGSEDRRVRMWSVQERRQITVLKGMTGEILSLAFHPDGRTLMTGAADGAVMEWGVDGWTGLGERARFDGGVWAVAYSPDGRILATGGEDEKVRVWALANPEKKFVLDGHTDWVRSLAFSPDGALLASAADDKNVLLWDTGDLSRVAALRGHSAAVWTARFSPDGRTLATGDADGEVRLWDLSTRQTVATFGPYGDGVWSVAFHPSGGMLAACSVDPEIQLLTRTG